jgi:hypothetical protein
LEYASSFERWVFFASLKPRVSNLERKETMSERHRVRALVSILALAFLVLGTSRNGSAQTLKESYQFEKALRTTEKLPWYEEEKIPTHETKPTSVACGYRQYVIRQERIGAKWGAAKIAWGFLGSGETKKIDPCTFPKTKGKLKAVATTGTKLLKESSGDTAKMSPGDKVVVVADDWDIERHKISGAVIGRVIGFRHYSKSFSVKMNNCLSPDDKVVCEASGSKTVKALNIIHYRLEQARKLKQAGDKRLCSIAAWGAAKTSRWIKKFKEEQQKDDHWAQGLTYKTRWDGSLTEEQAFALVDKSDRDAEALFTACGGPSPMPLEKRDYSLMP